jgi:ketosteroid isomerase-like protein
MIDLMHGTDTDVSPKTKGGSKAGVWVTLCVVVLAAVAGGSYWVKSHNKPVAGDTPEQLAAAVKNTDAKWSKAAQAHDLTTLFTFYADDATVLPANAELLTNKPSVQKYWTEQLTPGVDVSWTPMYVEVAASGDMAYDLGSYTITTKPVKGKGQASSDHGKYMAVWKKQADGSWKAEADTWNSDLPVAGAKAVRN